MNINKGLVLTVIVFLIGIFLGFSVGVLYKSKQHVQDKNMDSKLLSQIEKAKKLFPTIPEMLSVSGTVTKVAGNVITMESYPSVNPFEELPAIREIRVTKNTRIIKQEQKNPAEFQKELEEYQKKVQQSQAVNLSLANLTLPYPFIEVELKINDIKEGGTITVDTDKNIKNVTSFEATRVVVQVNNILAIPPLTPANIK